MPSRPKTACRQSFFSISSRTIQVRPQLCGGRRASLFARHARLGPKLSNRAILVGQSSAQRAIGRNSQRNVLPPNFFPAHQKIKIGSSGVWSLVNVGIGSCCRRKRLEHELNPLAIDYITCIPKAKARHPRDINSALTSRAHLLVTQNLNVQCTM
jgi:hypothetical protein